MAGSGGSLGKNSSDSAYDDSYISAFFSWPSARANWLRKRAKYVIQQWRSTWRSAFDGVLARG